MTRILLVEDEDNIRRILQYDLKHAGYEVVACDDGETALSFGEQEEFDVMLIDWMLPKISGVELVKHFREQGNDAIMMMLTAKDEEQDLLEAFAIGVDDYMIKPFSLKVLLARVQAHVKRLHKDNSVCQCGDIMIDMQQRKTYYQHEEIILTKKEFELLMYFIQHQGNVLSRDDILNDIWGFEYDGDTRIVDVHVFKLRSKLQKANVKITSSRGIGYCMEAVHE